MTEPVLFPGWTRTSNSPVNMRKTGDLSTVDADCGNAPDRKLDPMKSSMMDHGSE